MDNKEFLDYLLNRFIIEREKFDRSGIYAYTQRLLAYNSNKIEGSTLTEEQTASLFDNGTLPKSDDYYRAKDVEEMNGHFLMFNKMLDTLDETLSQGLIKKSPLYNFLKEMPYEALWCIISLRTKIHERRDLIRPPYYTTTNT